MKRHKRFVPYIRRLDSRDRGATVMVAIKMAALEQFGHGGYVMVQRGASHVIATAATRRELVRRILSCHTSPNGRTFRAWARRVGAYARGEPAATARRSGQ
jgi:hypothetical protein